MKSDGRKEEGRIWIRSSLLPQAKLPSRRPRSAARAPQAFLILCLPVRPARGLPECETANRAFAFALGGRSLGLRVRLGRRSAQGLD